MNQEHNTFIPTGAQDANSPMTVVPGGATGPTGLVPPGVDATQAQANPAEQPVPAGNEFLAAVATSAPTTAVNPNVLICSKCGNEMKKDARYCMKCGNLNYAHPDNESMKQYAWQSIKQGHFISGANLDDKQQLTMPSSDSVSDVHPYRACTITNIVLFVLSVGLTLFGLKDNLSGVAIAVAVITYGILYFELYSLQRLFIKADEPWWGIFVPFYGNFLVYKISLGSGWWMFTSVIPVVGTIVMLVSQYNLGKKFYKSGWLTLFFSFIMIPIIAFDKNAEYSMLAKAFNSDKSVDSKGRTKAEKNYGRKKFFITLLVVAVLAVALYFGWPYLVPIIDKVWELMQETISMFK